MAKSKGGPNDPPPLGLRVTIFSLGLLGLIVLCFPFLLIASGKAKEAFFSWKTFYNASFRHCHNDCVKRNEKESCCKQGEGEEKQNWCAMAGRMLFRRHRER